MRTTLVVLFISALLPTQVWSVLQSSNRATNHFSHSDKEFSSLRDLLADMVISGPISDDPESETSYWSRYSEETHPRENLANIRPRNAQHKNWMNSGKYQGDIAGIARDTGPNRRLQGGPGAVLRLRVILKHPNQPKYLNAVRDKTLTWPNGLVPYAIGPGFSPEQLKVINGALAKYHRDTCIRFVPRTYERNYLNIINDYGCYSLVGRTGGKQETSLGRGCVFHEIIVHELMHTLGFWHEQSRADRDNHVEVVWHNIIPGLQGQFDKIDYIYSDYLNEPYDYRSVMHYDSTAFSKNGRNTLESRVPGMTTVIGKALDLSDGDLRKINKMYKCHTHLSKIGRIPQPTTPPTTTTTTMATTTTTAATTTTRSSVGRKRTGGFVFPNLPPQSSEFSKGVGKCVDRFLDCPFFYRYCYRQSFYHVMKQYCPRTCSHCKDILTTTTTTTTRAPVTTQRAVSTINPWEVGLMVRRRDKPNFGTIGRTRNSPWEPFLKPEPEFRAARKRDIYYIAET